jgi:hypothetical protein
VRRSEGQGCEVSPRRTAELPPGRAVAVGRLSRFAKMIRC